MAAGWRFRNFRFLAVFMLDGEVMVGIDFFCGEWSALEVGYEVLGD